MSTDFINIATIITVVVTVIFLISTIMDARKSKKEQDSMASKAHDNMTDYDKILRSTHWLENAREKNSGTHFEDESIYLNKAKEIRTSSPLFNWINEY